MHTTSNVAYLQRITSPLDQPLAVAFFPDQTARTVRQETVTLRQLALQIEAARAPAKAQLEWLKLAQFGDRRSPKGSLRHNDNLISVSGIELDCDDNTTPPAEAARRLRAAGVAALIYTSPSHSVFKPRWRVLAPLAHPVLPADRRRLAGVLNAIVGGVASHESFTASQAYYYGEVDGADDHHVTLIDGKPLEDCEGIAPVYPAAADTKPLAIPERPPGTPAGDYARQVLAAAVQAFYEPEAAGACHPTITRVAKTAAPFVAGGWIEAEDVCDAIREHMPRAENGGEVESAVDWAVARAEAWTGGTEFDDLGEQPAATVAPRPRFTFGAAYVPRDPASIPPREWLYGGHYIRQFITATVAPGGVGKSSLALVEALDMATGRGLLTGKPTGQRHRVIYWNGEDPLIETERRVAAACLHFGITADELGDRLVICSGRALPIRIAEDTRDGFAIARPLVEEITADLIRSGADALILDPFVKSHGVSENDNNKIDAVASQWAAIADRANVSIELIHHLRKASGTGQDRGAEDARGGVALIAAARSVRVLNRMQDQEAVALGIPDETRRRLFRVDDGKANLQAPRGTGEQAMWRYLASVPLGNGQAGLAEDHVGVVTAWVKPAIGDNVTAEHVAEITRRLRAGEPNRRDPRSPDWAGKWIAGVLGVDLAGAGATKRVGKMLDVMVSQGRLGVGSEMDERRRPRATFAPVAPVLQSAENEPEQTGATGAVPGPHPCSTPVDRGCGGLERAKTVAAPVGEVERGKRRPGAADLAAMLAEGRA